MASYPPPYPPPPGAPYRQDPQAMKAQIRAQKAAFRAQRDMYRYQMRALLTSQRRGSILGPLVVVGAGVLLLLLSQGKLSYNRFADWYSHWWPMLLVIAGVILVVEWALDQRTRPEGVPYVRRGIGGGAIFLIILLALTGASLSGLRNGHDVLVNGLSINPDNLDEFFGDKHEMTQTLEQEFAPGTTLTLDNPHGDITIAGTSTDGKLHMTVNKQVWTHSDESADGKADKLNPRVTLAGSMLNVAVPWVRGATSDLSITLPANAAVAITSNHGTVNVSEMKAPVTVTANHGDVQLNSVTGAVNAHINHSDSSFSAHAVTGDVTVRGHAQDLNLTEVAGQVSLEGEFFGETHLEHIAGPVSFRTNRTQFSLVKLDGEVDISPNSELTGSQIVGPTSLRTSSRNISFNRVAGDVDVTNSRGTVEVSSAAPLGNVTIQNRDGAVNLTIPEHSGVVVDAETRGGTVENDLGLSSASDHDRESVRGTVGDGKAHVMIRTNHFDVQIHRAEIAPPAPPSPPAAPALPVAPGAGAPAPAAKVPAKAKTVKGKAAKPAEDAKPADDAKPSEPGI